MAESNFCVVVHDVTPVFTPEIDQILAAFEPLVGSCLSGAVVPCWHGRRADAADIRQFQRWNEQFGELLLHGWTHFRETSPGIISCATGRADEFGGATSAEAARQLAFAQSEIQSLVGRTLRGFVPPAWQFPVKLADIQSAGVEYLVRFSRCEALGKEPVALATWSWDWGWLYGSSLAGAWLGTLRHVLVPAAVPVIALHPLDVPRDCLRRAVSLTRHLLETGYRPLLTAELSRFAPSEQVHATVA